MSAITRKMTYFGWDSDRLAAYLNRMSQQGLALCGVGLFTFQFAPCVPNEFQYAVQFMKRNAAHPENKSYVAFLQQSGVEWIGKRGNFAIFRRRTEPSPFELFSDRENQMQQSKGVLTILWLLFTTSVINLIHYGFDIVYNLRRAQPLLLPVLFLSLWLVILIVVIVPLVRITKRRTKQMKDKNLFE